MAAKVPNREFCEQFIRGLTSFGMGFLKDAKRYAQRLAAGDEALGSDDEVEFVEQNVDRMNEIAINLRNTV